MRYPDNSLPCRVFWNRGTAWKCIWRKVRPPLVPDTAELTILIVMIRLRLEPALSGVYEFKMTKKRVHGMPHHHAKIPQYILGRSKPAAYLYYSPHDSPKGYMDTAMSIGKTKCLELLHKTKFSPHHIKGKLYGHTLRTEHDAYYTICNHASPGQVE